MTKTTEMEKNQKPAIFLSTRIKEEDFTFFFGKNSLDVNDYFYLPEGVYERFFKKENEVIILEYSDILLAYGGPLYDKNWHATISSLFDDINCMLKFELPIIIITQEHYLSELIPTIMDHYEKEGVEVFDIRFDDNLFGGMPLPRNMYAVLEFYDIPIGEEDDVDDNQDNKNVLEKKQPSEDQTVEQESVYIYFIVPFIENQSSITFDEHDLMHRISNQ